MDGASAEGRPRLSCRSGARDVLSVVLLLANRHIAGGQPNSVKRHLGEAQPLIHIGHDLDHLADEIPVLIFDDFRDEARADGLAILIQLHLPVGRVPQDQCRQRFTELFVTIAQIAIDLIKRLKCGLGFVIVVDGAERWAGEPLFLFAAGQLSHCRL